MIGVRAAIAEQSLLDSELSVSNTIRIDPKSNRVVRSKVPRHLRGTHSTSYSTNVVLVIAVKFRELAHLSRGPPHMELLPVAVPRWLSSSQGTTFFVRRDIQIDFN